MAVSKKAGSYDQDLMRDMKVVQERLGIGLTRQVLDYLALAGAGTGLTFEEYHFFELYKHSRADYAGYMGDHRARAAFFLANDLSNWDAAEDKLNFAQAMAAAGLPTPEIRALAHATRTMEGIRSLASEDDVRAFLQSCALPVFGKPAMASHGDGAVQITGRRGEQFVNDCGDMFNADQLSNEIAGYVQGSGYLFQEVLQPHEGIAKITGGRLATMRMLVMLGPDGPAMRHALLRMAAGDNRVDNFRRKGNLIAPVDRASGMLGPAHCGIGPASQQLAAHPDTGERIDGFVVPGFAQAAQLACTASLHFPTLHLQSWDVAVTDQGPVLLEMNPGGNFNILQLAAGHGVFDAEFRTFLEWRLADNTNAHVNAKALKEARKLLKL